MSFPYIFGLLYPAQHGGERTCAEESFSFPRFPSQSRFMVAHPSTKLAPAPPWDLKTATPSPQLSTPRDRKSRIRTGRWLPHPFPPLHVTHRHINACSGKMVGAVHLSPNYLGSICRPHLPFWKTETPMQFLTTMDDNFSLRIR